MSSLDDAMVRQFGVTHVGGRSITGEHTMSSQNRVVAGKNETHEHYVHIGGWGVGPMSKCKVCKGNKPPTPEKRRRKNVDHPAHYGGKDNPYEAIKVIEAWSLGFCLGNVVKYVSRADKKGAPLDDLRKAVWYLQREIKRRTPDVRKEEE